MLRRASRFDLTIDKGGNSNTLVPTTALRPDVTAKRCSRGTWEYAEFDSTNSKELVVKGKYNEVVKKVDARICVKTCVWLIDRYPITLTRGLYLYPDQKSYNQTWLGLKFQIEQNPYTKRTLITKENIKLSSTTDPYTAMSQLATLASSSMTIGRPPFIAIDNHQHWPSAWTHHHSWT